MCFSLNAFSGQYPHISCWLTLFGCIHPQKFPDVTFFEPQEFLGYYAILIQSSDAYALESVIESLESNALYKRSALRQLFMSKKDLERAFENCRIVASVKSGQFEANILHGHNPHMAFETMRSGR